MRSLPVATGPRRFVIAIFLLCGLLLQSAAFSQQYRVFTWESFETGTVPDKMYRGHFANDSNVSIVDLTHPQAPPAVQSGIASLEVGRFAAIWRPFTEDSRHLSLFLPDGLDRGRLGQNGAALYQADFYLPPEGQAVPNISMLAQVLNDDGSTNYKFYRFGILEPGERLFFSFTNDEPQPAIYESVLISEFNLRRPGWHRFQIIFRGPSEIYCAVDGQFTSFSPINDSTHQKLNAGIMVTSTEMTNIALTDNLSIQWSPEQAPLPKSPWTMQQSTVPQADASPLETGNQLLWLNDPSEAWKIAARQKRPLLVMFYVPDIGPYRYLKSIVPENEEAYRTFGQYVLLKIDANQLLGGQLAEKFNIVRLPTFMIMGPDGNERDRFVVVNRQTQWAELKAALTTEAPEEPSVEETSE